MPTMREMSEAHLINVEREIQSLQQRRVEIDAQLQQLESYLEEGKKTLLELPPTESSAPSFSPTLGTGG